MAEVPEPSYETFIRPFTVEAIMNSYGHPKLAKSRFGCSGLISGRGAEDRPAGSYLPLIATPGSPSWGPGVAKIGVRKSPRASLKV
jgi:hypothetical protein